jgi:hypothetical protein
MKENVPITDPVWMVDPTWMEKTGGFARDMTLRDHYAGLALQGQLSMPELCVAISSGSATVTGLCASCFAWADAMLKAREGK